MQLKFFLINQYGAFNSPVWFNCGVEEHPQVSACFINSVDDTMESIMGLARTEAMLFKGGSGAGSNLSSIRSSKEHLAGGGTASGPVSFMRGFDAFAGVIKSGGKTRRAAKMVILDADHPDIEEFIWCKAREERKARALAAAGFDMSLDGSDIHSIQYQNANNSVRVTDEFMEAATTGGEWWTRSVTTGERLDRKDAAKLLSLQPASLQLRFLQTASEIAEDAFALQAVGCFAIVFEAVPAAVTEAIMPRIEVPVIGIGAGTGSTGKPGVMSTVSVSAPARPWTFNAWMSR